MPSEIPMSIEKYVPADLLELYEVHDFRHAAAILAHVYTDEFADLCQALRTFRFTEEQVKARGGNESAIPKAFSKLLRPRWKPEKLKADLKIAYQTNLIWYKVRKDGGPDRRGVGFYFRNVTEMILFGVRGTNVRTLKPGRTMPNIVIGMKQGHSIKPQGQFDLIEQCSWAPFLELFARRQRHGWYQWGDEFQSRPDENVPFVIPRRPRSRQVELFASSGD